MHIAGRCPLYYQDQPSQHAAQKQTRRLPICEPLRVPGNYEPAGHVLSYHNPCAISMSGKNKASQPLFHMCEDTLGHQFAQVPLSDFSEPYASR